MYCRVGHVSALLLIVCCVLMKAVPHGITQSTCRGKLLLLVCAVSGIHLCTAERALSALQLGSVCSQPIIVFRGLISRPLLRVCVCVCSSCRLHMCCSVKFSNPIVICLEQSPEICSECVWAVCVWVCQGDSSVSTARIRNSQRCPASCSPG
jgi:hypothetical protein